MNISAFYYTAWCPVDISMNIAIPFFQIFFYDDLVSFCISTSNDDITFC